jgi:hypothetical protein
MNERSRAAPLYAAVTTDDMRIRQDELRVLGFTTLDPEMRAAMPSMWRRYFEQPDGMPDGVHPRPPLLMCINPPSRIASSATWRHFRDDMAEASDHPYYAALVVAVDDLLAWREAVPADERFWKPDV